MGAIGKFKSGKSESDFGILPEMVKAASYEKGFFHLLMDIVHAAWCECRVPRGDQIQYWSQYRRKVTLVSVITGGEYLRKPSADSHSISST